RHLHPLGAHPFDRLRDRQGADRCTLRGGGAQDGVDEASRDQRADRVVYHDDLRVLGRRLQRKPHRVLARAAAGDDREGRVLCHTPEDPPRARHPGLGRGDDDGAHRRVAGEVTDGRRQDRRPSQSQELLGRTGAEARTHAARGDDGGHLRHRRGPAPRRRASSRSFRSTSSTPAMSTSAISTVRPGIRWSRPSTSKPRRPRLRLSASDESAIRWSSRSTKPGTTSGPSRNPVPQTSAIRPSMIAEVSKILSSPRPPLVAGKSRAEIADRSASRPSATAAPTYAPSANASATTAAWPCATSAAATRPRTNPTPRPASPPATPQPTRSNGSAA